MIVYCGTSNPGKLREFQLAAPDFEIRGVAAPPPPEHEPTFEDAARSKALYYGSHVKSPSENHTDSLTVAARIATEPRASASDPSLDRAWVFADDSGLEVDALHGAPGVHSARFAGPDANDERNNALLLERLRGAKDRSARFVCAIALVRHGRVEKTFHGTVEGRILDAPRGSHGFGYDPLFYYEPFGCTFGEATDAQKMQVSHRAQALQAMFDFLRAASL